MAGVGRGVGGPAGYGSSVSGGRRGSTGGGGTPDGPAGGEVQRTADGRYLVIGGRRWRASDPSLPEDVRRELVAELMAARRAVGRALRARDGEAERDARRRVHAAKVALGERGQPWWERDRSVQLTSGEASRRP